MKMPNSFAYYQAQPINEIYNNFYRVDVDEFIFIRTLKNFQNNFYETSGQMFVEEFVKRFLKKSLTNVSEKTILKPWEKI